VWFEHTNKALLSRGGAIAKVSSSIIESLLLLIFMQTMEALNVCCVVLHPFCLDVSFYVHQVFFLLQLKAVNLSLLIQLQSNVAPGMKIHEYQLICRQ